MFGIGGQEIVLIGLLFLIIFGPSKLPQMARDIGRFVGEARRSIDEFKDELTASDDEDREREERERKQRAEQRRIEHRQTENGEPSRSKGGTSRDEEDYDL